MSKAVMISIQPKWCELIASGKKTIEVRKTKPNIDTPFKCYIYCSQNQFMACKNNGGFWFAKRNSLIQPIDSIQFSGKVIGEFVCDYVDIYKYDYCDGVDIDDDTLLETMLDREEINIYANGKPLYGLHISQLKIYDKPKELSEFFVECYKEDSEQCNDCPYLQIEHCSYPIEDCVDTWCGVFNQKPLTRPPQSWCYVEELNNEI